MKPLPDELEQRTVFQRLQFRLFGWLAGLRPDEIERLRRNRPRRERLRHLIEQPGIDGAVRRHTVRFFVMDERLAKEFAHLAVDFARPEVVVIEKNLELGRVLFVVVRQRDENLWRSLPFRRVSDVLSLLHFVLRRRPQSRGECDR